MAISIDPVSKYRRSVPHPCAFSLAQGWESSHSQRAGSINATTTYDPPRRNEHRNRSSSRREETKIAQDEILGKHTQRDTRPVGSRRTQSREPRIALSTSRVFPPSRTRPSSRREETKIAQDEILGKHTQRDTRPVGSRRTQSPEPRIALSISRVFPTQAATANSDPGAAISIGSSVAQPTSAM